MNVNSILKFPNFRFGYAAFTLMAIGIVGFFSVCTWYLCEANYSDVRPGPAGSWRDSFRKRNKRKIPQEVVLRQQEPAATEGLLQTDTAAVNIAQEEVLSSLGEGEGAQDESVSSPEAVEGDINTKNADNTTCANDRIDTLNETKTDEDQNELPPKYAS